MFTWFAAVSPRERRTFWACFGGWALDALDMQMFSLVIPAIVAEWSLSRTQAGFVGGATLVASALGGWVAGMLSDRFGRVRTLQWTIACFSVGTFACAFATSYPQFVTLKTLQGIGFGGEWAAGAVLMAETIRAEHRGKAMGAVQSAWALGWGSAVLLYALAFSLLPAELAWRAMFAIGLLPALLIVYVRRGIAEPSARALNPSGPCDPPEPPNSPDGAPPSGASPAVRASAPLVGIFSRGTRRMTLIGALLGVGAHGGYYALMTWLPTYLKTERHLSVLGTGGYLAVIIVAFFCGCLASAQLLDRIGRRGTILAFAACCVGTVILTCSRRSATRRCSRSALRSAFSRRASRQAWARCSTKCIRAARAARASAFATTSGASHRRAFRCWSGTCRPACRSAPRSASARRSPIRSSSSPC